MERWSTMTHKHRRKRVKTDLVVTDEIPSRMGRNQRAIQTFLCSGHMQVRVVRKRIDQRILYKSLWDTINSFGYENVVGVKSVNCDVYLYRKEGSDETR
jgi:hypothetical protein